MKMVEFSSRTSFPRSTRSRPKEWIRDSTNSAQNSEKKLRARAKQEKAQAAEETQRKARADAEKAANAAAAAAQTKPRPAVDENTDCATLYRLYRESLDCFAPYITANGTTKAETFAKCTTVPDPSRKCGPAK